MYAGVDEDLICQIRHDATKSCARLNTYSARPLSIRMGLEVRAWFKQG
jgi:hypothetical protein